ncbi:MAG: hypothetical protein L0H64_00640 [Pseudonocardia sp.]|nr:hypothetical protein [Pseudonocardia sp.]
MVAASQGYGSGAADRTALTESSGPTLMRTPTVYIVIRYKVQPGSGNAEITTGIVDLSWADMP